MRVKIKPNDGGNEYTKMSKVSIGDFVKLDGFVYCVNALCKLNNSLWGSDYDGFVGIGDKEIEDSGRGYEYYAYFIPLSKRESYRNKDGLYGNLWKVVNFAVHPSFKQDLLVHVVDRLGRNALFYHKCLSVVKKNPKKAKKTINIEQLKNWE